MAYIDHIKNDQDNSSTDLYSKLLANNLAEEFNKTKAYQTGEYVINHPYLYKSRIDQPAGDFVPANWERKTIIDAIYDIVRTILSS